MKLYTEKQVYKALWELEHPFLDGKEIYKIVSKLIPIELPSDEEIENYSMKFYDNNGSDIYFTNGAKWILKQIKQQNNGN